MRCCLARPAARSAATARPTASAASGMNTHQDSLVLDPVGSAVQSCSTDFDGCIVRLGCDRMPHACSCGVQLLTWRSTTATFKPLVTGCVPASINQNCCQTLSWRRADGAARLHADAPSDTTRNISYFGRLRRNMNREAAHQAEPRRRCRPCHHQTPPHRMAPAPGAPPRQRRGGIARLQRLETRPVSLALCFCYIRIPIDAGCAACVQGQACRARMTKTHDPTQSHSWRNGASQV